MEEKTPTQLNNFLLYTTPKGGVPVEVYIQQESVWLTQKAIATLFGVGVPAISKHLKNIFEQGELIEDSVISILETTAEDEKYRIIQDQIYESDFDKEIKKLKNG